MREIDRVLCETEIPELELRDAPLREAFSFLSQKTGVRFVNALLPVEPADPKVSFHLWNKPASEARRYLSCLTHTRHEINPEAVLIIWSTMGGNVMEVGKYHVPFKVMIRLLKRTGFPVDGKTDGRLLGSPASLQECFEKLVLTFPGGSSIRYQPHNGETAHAADWHRVDHRNPRRRSSCSVAFPLKSSFGMSHFLIFLPPHECRF